jgi:hypothetical protein
MFEDWKHAWRQAVENFQREVAGAPDGAVPRVRAMERELASAGGALLKLEEEIRRTRRDAAAELEAEQVCRRRERLARDVHDEETVRVAAEFAVRHAERAAVLQRKIAVLEDERALLARDVDGMREVIAETPAPDRGPTSATSRMNAGESSTRADNAADREFSRLENDARDRAASERLEELKRRMATDQGG